MTAELIEPLRPQVQRGDGGLSAGGKSAVRQEMLKRRSEIAEMMKEDA